MEEQWGEEEKPGAGAVIPNSSLGSPTKENPTPALDTELDGPHLGIQRPVATRQTMVNDFMSAIHQPTLSGDAVATASEEGVTGPTEWVERGKGSKKIICLDSNFPPVTPDMNLDNPGGECPVPNITENRKPAEQWVTAQNNRGGY